MKVQKLSSNKAIIIMTNEELNKRKITITDLKEGKKKAQNFFFEILEESKISEEFEIDSSQLLIEVTQSMDELFTITITKADCIPDKNLVAKIKSAKNVCYIVSSNIYGFENIDNLYEFALEARIENLYVGNNSLYTLDNMYYIHFSNSTIKNNQFVKTFSVISEYSSKYFSKKSVSFLEHATLLLKNNAIQTIQNI